MKLPRGLQRDHPLGRLTTIGTGGCAEFFARAGNMARLEALVSWAADTGLEVGVVGSGSNLLVADKGVQGLVLKLERDLAKIELSKDRLVCGGGARLPRAAVRAAAAGLGGLEFAVNIPGTVGGAVRMNANAYGGSLGALLEWVDVVTPGGSDRRGVQDLGLAYRRSNLGPYEVVASAGFGLNPGDPSEIKRRLRQMRARRKATQPVGIRTFGSTFKNPDDPKSKGMSAGQLLDAAGCRGLRIGGARFSEKHANFVENLGDATTGDVLKLMTEGYRRVLDRFGVRLEPEVQLVGAASWPFEHGDGPEAHGADR